MACLFHHLEAKASPKVPVILLLCCIENLIGQPEFHSEIVSEKLLFESCILNLHSYGFIQNVSSLSSLGAGG